MILSSLIHGSSRYATLVLYSITMADLLTSLGEAGLYHPRWTQEIHNELIRNVIEHRGESGAVTRAWPKFWIPASVILSLKIAEFAGFSRAVLERFLATPPTGHYTAKPRLVMLPESRCLLGILLIVRCATGPYADIVRCSNAKHQRRARSFDDERQL